MVFIVVYANATYGSLRDVHSRCLMLLAMLRHTKISFLLFINLAECVHSLLRVDLDRYNDIVGHTYRYMFNTVTVPLVWNVEGERSRGRSSVSG